MGDAFSPPLKWRETMEQSGTKKSFGEWIKSRKGQQMLIILAFTIIPLILLLVFTYLPFAEMVKFSFYKMKYVGARKFVGLDNYRAIFKRDDIIGALKLCLYYMAGALIQLAIALYLATILSMKVKCSNLFKGFMFFPYLINGIAIGFIFKFFYTRGFVFDTVLQWCGFQLDNLPYWLKDQSVNNWSLVGSSVWRYFGQNMVLFVGAIMSVDDSLYEAADLDGASYFTIYSKILLPLLKPAIVTSIILKGANTYNEYYCAQLYLQDKTRLCTVVTSLYTFTGPLGSQYNLICAGVIISLLPALIVFIIFQNQIYSGVAAGAVKG